MIKKLSTEDFIERARKIHGNKYDYSKVIYLNNETKVCIVCPVHGEFWQTPHSHLKGRGCPECAKISIRRQREVICDYCGKIFSRQVCYDKRNNKHIFCCKECEAEFRKFNNSVEEWRGGHISKTTGYKYIRINGKDVGEHDLVIMKFLGRELREDEVVHHIDGNKLNNSMENLVVMSRREHAQLHNSRGKSVKACARCGKERVIHGRGLCSSCYGYCLKYKKINEYELSKKYQKE